MRDQIIALHYLYHLQMFAEEFCDEICHTQTPPSQSSQILGWDPKGAKIGFVTPTPSLDSKNSFLTKKSSQMLQDIISKVFFLTQRECGIFSLYKTLQDTPHNPDENTKYTEILLAQILHSHAKVFVIFGLEEVGGVLFPNQNLQLGKAVGFRGKTLVFTHSFKALLRLESLKKQTMQHLKYAKALL